MAAVPADDPRLGPLTDLPGARRHDVVVAEGTEAVRWMLRSGWDIGGVLLRPATWEKLAHEIASAGVDHLVVGADAAGMAAVLGYPSRRGAAAWAHRPAPQDLGSWLQTAIRPRRLLLADGIHDPSNVGGLIRTARCLGLSGLIVDRTCADPLSRRAVRTSVGHACHLPLFSVDDLAKTLTALSAAGLWTAAAHRGPLSRNLSPGLAVPTEWALVVGNEDRGVSPAVVEAVDERLAITMAGGVDSLNVAVAAGIACHWLCTGHAGLAGRSGGDKPLEGRRDG